MGSRTTRDGRATAPTPPAITDDALSDMLERALATDAHPERRPAPPEITAADVRRLFEDAGLFADDAVAPGETTPATPAAPVEVTAADSEPTVVPRERQCSSCYGSGTETCASCYGSGSQTISYTTTDWEGNVEYVTDWVPCGCSGGTVACGWCGGRGTVFQ